MLNLRARKWTLEELDALPEDGNRYELLDGELLVSPAPSDVHQGFCDWLADKLWPFVSANGLGRLQFPRSVVVIDGSQVEPDLMVRPIAPLRGWANAPLPILVVEVLSRSTASRDLRGKRDFYMKKGIAEYWIVDRYTQSVIRVQPEKMETITSILTWAPKNTAATLDIDVAAMFAEMRS